MPATYEPIASQTLGSNSASVTFSSIPGTFTDLVLVANARSTHTADAYEGMTLRYNSDSGSNYSRTYLLYGPGSTRASNASSAESVMNHGSSNTNLSVIVVNIMSYANTNVFKTSLHAGAGLGNFYGLDRTVNLWRSTAAITSITIASAQGANLASGSTFSLFGVKAA